MAIDTLMAYVGVYDSVADAEADYQLVKELHVEAGLIDAYDAAVVQRREDGKTKIVKKHETPTRVGGVLGGGVGLATGLVVALFPFAAIGGGLLVGTTAGGAILGAVAGHAAMGMSRHDLKDLGEHLDRGEAGLVVVAVSDMEAKVQRAMKRAAKVEQRELKADNEQIERDAAEAGKVASSAHRRPAGSGPGQAAVAQAKRDTLGHPSVAGVPPGEAVRITVAVQPILAVGVPPRIGVSSILVVASGLIDAAGTRNPDHVPAGAQAPQTPAELLWSRCRGAGQLTISFDSYQQAWFDPVTHAQRHIANLNCGVS